jgi:putative membrane protein insertion efficiency factor
MRRQYGPYGDPYPSGYGRRRWGRYPRQPGYVGSGSCLRDACLLETGCCVGEAIDNSCLLSGLLLVPNLLGALGVGLRGSGDRPMVGALVGAVRLYQREISAHRPSVCRFSPSCSQYAVEALETHGAWKGVRLAAARLLRCRPGGRRGADPVPALAA